MANFEITLFSLKFSTTICIEFTEKTIWALTNHMALFGAESNGKGLIKFDQKQQYTEVFQEKLRVFIDLHKTIMPEVQQLTKYFKQLDDNEYFFAIPTTLAELNTKKRFELESALYALNNISIDTSESIELFKNVMDNYELINFDIEKERLHPIGERSRDLRVCRFCKKSKPSATFKKKAHAISEALGNKKLILNEECDSCNEFFDENIERDFIHCHDFARTAFGIKNKKNEIPCTIGKNFRFFKDHNNNNVLQVSTSNYSTSLKLHSRHKIVQQNIYKTLCKYALSVIDTSLVRNFDETMLWLMGVKHVNKLPKVALLKSNHFFTETPRITLFIRNNNNTQLPYCVCEFRFTLYLYIFIIPFSNQDSLAFLSENEYEMFLECYKNIKYIHNFRYIDLSSNIPEDYSLILNITK